MNYYRLPKDYDKEIADFKDKLNDFLKGNLEATEFKKTTSSFGIYEQKTPGTYMQRVRLAGGIIDVDTFEKLTELCEKFSGSFFHITTRQNLQFHGVQPGKLGELQEELSKLSLLTKTSGGNCVRNVLIDIFSGVSPDDVFDVTPFGVELSNRLAEFPFMAELPRKFKIAFSSSQADRAIAKIADLGFVAVVKNGKKGFETYTGGGLGSRSKTGFKIADFVPAEDVLKHAVAYTSLFVEHGFGVSRGYARLRFLIERLTREKFEELLSLELEKHKDNKELELNILLHEQVKDAEDFVYTNDLWFENFVTPQKQKNRFSVKIPFFFGQVNKKAAESIIAFCRKYPETEIRFTQTQNILLRNIKGSALGEVRSCSESIDKLTNKNGFLSDIKACVGTDFCRLSIAGSSKLLKAIIESVSEESELKNIENIRIGISGCPNGCAHTIISDIGFSGRQRKVKDEVKEAYMIFAGGSPENLGTEIGELFTEEIPAFLCRVLKLYSESKHCCFSEFLSEKGLEEIKKLLY